MKPDIIWTDDCQGKKDYDGALVEVSTRYWPRGGGMFIVNNGKIMGNETRPKIKPSARSQIILSSSGDGLPLMWEEFEADTEEEVKAQVEKWVEERYDEIAKILLDHFGGREEA